MKIWKVGKAKVVRVLKVSGGLATVLLANGAFAVVTVPTELADVFVDGAAMALLIVGLGTIAYGTYRGAIIAINVAKKMLSKAGL